MMQNSRDNKIHRTSILLKQSFVVCTLGVTLFSIIIVKIKCPFDPVPIHLQSPRSFTGALARNARLANAELYFKGSIASPESVLVTDEMTIFSGLVSRKIIEGNSDRKDFTSFSYNHLCKVPETCKNHQPLGIRMDSWHRLWIADNYLGILVYEPNHKKIYSIYEPPNNGSHHFFNDLDFLPDGTVVFTDSTTTYGFDDLVYEFLEGRPNGKLLRYDPHTKAVSTMLDELHFPNGVQTHQDGESILISESSTYRILRYYYIGSRKGTVEIFANNLPGPPDNIRPSSDGGFWVAMVPTRLWSFLSMPDLVANRPWIRSLLGKLLSSKLLHSIGQSHGCLIIRLDRHGRIVDSLWDVSGSRVNQCSQAWETRDGWLYIGSFSGDNIARVKL